MIDCGFNMRRGHDFVKGSHLNFNPREDRMGGPSEILGSAPPSRPMGSVSRDRPQFSVPRVSGGQSSSPSRHGVRAIDSHCQDGPWREMIPFVRCPLGTEREQIMPEQPKLNVEDLPEDESQLNEKELDAVNGGLGRPAPIRPTQSRGVLRTGDPCMGGE